MTLNDLLLASYTWADRQATLIFAASLLLPVAGTLLAWIGKGGRTDRDGRFVASALVGFSFALVLFEAAAVFAARSALGASLLDANALLLAAPVICLAGSLLGIRAVFPLSELGSVRAMSDAAAFLAACAGALWLLSKFRGWGVLFLGSFVQLIVVGAVGLFFLWRLYRRAFGHSGRASTSTSASTSTPLAAPPGGSAAALALSASVVIASLGIFALFARLQSGTPSGPVSAAGDSVTGAPGSGPVAVREGARAKRYFAYEDADGAQQIVESLEQVPERYRAGARELTP
jgi:hypothetical protein